MKKLLIALTIATSVALTGCATTDPLVPAEAIHYKYVVNVIPDQMLTVPPPVPNLDTKTATDLDAANWMADKEKRAKELENRLNAVKSYQTEKLQNMNVPKADLIIQ